MADIVEVIDEELDEVACAEFVAVRRLVADPVMSAVADEQLLDDFVSLFVSVEDVDADASIDCVSIELDWADSVDERDTTEVGVVVAETVEQIDFLPELVVLAVDDDDAVSVFSAGLLVIIGEDVVVTELLILDVIVSNADNVIVTSPVEDTVIISGVKDEIEDTEFEALSLAIPVVEAVCVKLRDESGVPVADDEILEL